MKRGYFGKECEEAEYGYAIVANTAKEAKKLLYNIRNVDGEGEWNWMDLIIEWKRNSKVDHLPIGVIEDLRTGLEVGIFGYIENFECDICGGDDSNYVEFINGKCVCEKCRDNLKDA